MSPEPAEIGKEIRRELDRLGPGAAIGKLVAAWPAAVGTAIAANAWPARVARDGTLHVATSSSAWAFELTQCEAAIREGLREQLGVGTPPRLRFAVGMLPERGAEEVTSRARPAPEVSSAARAEAEEMARGIGGEELRELVVRAIAATLARGRKQARDRPV